MPHTRKGLRSSPMVFGLVGLCLIGSLLAQVPDGWARSGSKPQEYEVGVDTAVFHNGKRSGFVASKAEVGEGFGTLGQVFKSDAFRGKRLRMTVYAKSEGVGGYAGAWLRVDGEGGTLALDNMVDRPIKGTTGWKEYELILDVPDNSTGIAFGILLRGKGRVWIDDLRFDFVGKNVWPTGMPLPAPTGARPPRKLPVRELPKQPVNLDFEGAKA